MEVVVEPTRMPAWSPAREWMRVQYVSKEAENVWKPRLDRISRALGILEVESVYQNIRPSALIFCSPEELVSTTKDALARGAVAFVLNLEGAPQGAYSASSRAYDRNQPFKFRTIITRDYEPWLAYEANDEAMIGKLLGYPDCCTEFFRKYWIEEQWRDTTWPMSRGGTQGTPYSNILLRWLNVRLIRHLPCSLGCQASEYIGRQTESLGIDMGFEEEMEWALQLLDMSVEWSSLNGIAEVRLPILRFSTNTDPLNPKAVVRKEGNFIPDEAATGLVFPFLQLSKRKVSQSKSFKASLEENTWSDNGFSSKAAMDQAHDVLLTALQGVELDPGSDVLDLGCGNGVLLEKICAKWVGVNPHGVELNKERAKAAYDRLSGGFVFPGNITDLTLWDQNYDLIIFMAGRIPEMPNLDAARVLAQLTKSDRILLYTYADHSNNGISEIEQRLGYKEFQSSSANGVSASLLVRAGVS